MGIHTLSSKGDFAAARRVHYSVAIPYFYNFRSDDGKITMEVSWKKNRLDEHDYREHRSQNCSLSLAMQNVAAETAIFPYRYEHFSDLPQGQRFTISADQLENWLYAAEDRPVNEANSLLVAALQNAVDYLPVFKLKIRNPERVASVVEAQENTLH